MTKHQTSRPKSGRPETIPQFLSHSLIAATFNKALPAVAANTRSKMTIFQPSIAPGLLAAAAELDASRAIAGMVEAIIARLLEVRHCWLVTVVSFARLIV
ncbi:MAG: hypothetical protein DHS20C12_05610 [Pseudohongiella sp.]|nr:MAG: hypothetical protein DHS20C12_05610 [Pseudohongiella sp.]